MWFIQYKKITTYGNGIRNMVEESYDWDSTPFEPSVWMQKKEQECCCCQCRSRLAPPIEENDIHYQFVILFATRENGY